jgi:hypothetical protein
MTPFDTILPAAPCHVGLARLFTIEEVHWLHVEFTTRGTKFSEVFSGPSLVDLVCQLTTRIGFGLIAATEIVRLATNGTNGIPASPPDGGKKN